jgi:tetratricopeptide (TPR) repeat protein
MLYIKTSGIKQITRKLVIVFCTFLNIIFPTVTFSQVNGYTSVAPTKMFGNNISGSISIDNARSLILTDHINESVVIYAQLVDKDSTNSVLASEYAYSLALAGIYDAALSHLDKVWNYYSRTPDVIYFTSQVLALMGNTDLANALWKESAKNKPPIWITSKASELIAKRGMKKPDQLWNNRGDMVVYFKRANKLASLNFNLQSIVLFRKIIDRYPTEYVPYIGYSISLEKIGLLDKSVESLEKGITLIPENPDNTETKKILEKRLSVLKNKLTLAQSTQAMGLSSNKNGLNNPQMLMYAGAVLGAYTSLNFRLGYFTSQSSNGSISLGIANKSATIGLSMYNRNGIFVTGIGLNYSIGSALYAKISVGVSLMNKTHTASYDIFLDGNAPITKGYPTNITLSIGRSIYFGKRK